MSYEVDYEVDSVAKVVDYTTGFIVVNPADVAGLCGPITYTVVSGASSEIVDSATASELTIYSNNKNMVNPTATVVIQSKLTDYPGEIIGTDLKITINFMTVTVVSSF